MAIFFELLHNYSNVVFAIALLVIPLYMLWQDNKAAASKKKHEQKIKTDEPTEPPLYPYWIPWLGHAPAFLLSANNLVESALAYFGSSRPFRLHVGGQPIYILTDPADVRTLYRHTRELTFDPFVVDIVKNVYHFSVADLYALSLARDDVTGSFTTSALQESHVFYRAHLAAGSTSLAALKTRWVGELAATLATITPGSKGELYPFVRNLISTAASNAVMGRRFLAQNPAEILEALWDFDDAHIYMLYRIPPFLLRKGFAARDVLLRELEHYLFVAPPAVGSEDRTELIWNRQQRITNLGLSNRAVASLQLTIYWAMQTNSVRAAYWTLQHILADPILTAAILSEIAPAFDASSNISSSNSSYRSRELTNPEHLVDAEKCPHLTAAILEALRLSSGSSSSREVEADVILNGRHHLKKGAKILAPTIQPHLAPEYWGYDAPEFRHDRWFTPNPNTAAAAAAAAAAVTIDGKMVGAPAYRPFGGGETYCPGRLFAKFQIATFVAATIWRWDVSLLRDPRQMQIGRGTSGGLPIEDRQRPAIGVLDPKGVQARTVIRERK